ncbi:hypothetical protein [Sinimarinibacterium flocculans]|uniref:hypothetical protein n=1 Tax=Sinimarinibacterium flocculans TaxID=985250 RepID=UPI003511F1AF
MNNVTVPASARHLAPVLCAATLLLGGCGGGGGGDGGNDNPVPLNDPNALMSALSDKIESAGSVSVVLNTTGPEPAPNADTPKVTAVESATAEPGQVLELPVTVPGGANLSALFAKVPSASSYFEINLPPSGGKQGSSPAIPIINFRVQLPDNLEVGGATDTFCLEFWGLSGDDRGPKDQSCIKIVAERPAPQNDQPQTDQVPAALAGDWLSGCFAQDDGNGSAREVISFTGANQYASRFDVFNTTDCSGLISGQTPVVMGSYAVEDAELSSQGYWVRDIDFLTDSAAQELGAEACYNLLRLEDGKLLLGYPIPYTLATSQSPVEGDCRTQATRPTRIIFSLPFTRG